MQTTIDVQRGSDGFGHVCIAAVAEAIA